MMQEARYDMRGVTVWRRDLPYEPESASGGAQVREEDVLTAFHVLAMLAKDKPFALTVTGIHLPVQ